MDFGKCQDRIGLFSLSKNDSNYLDDKLEVFKRDDKRDFRLVQNLTIREADFKQFLRWRSQLAIAAENFGRGKVVPSTDTNNIQRHR